MNESRPKKESAKKEVKKERGRSNSSEPNKWSEIHRNVRDTRKLLRHRVTDASDILKENAIEWSAVLYPDLNISKSTHGPTPTIPEDAEPVVNFSLNEELFTPFPSDPPRNLKLAILRGTITVTCAIPPPEVEGVRVTGPSADVQDDQLLFPESNIFEGYTYNYPTDNLKNKVIISVPKGATISDINEVVNSLSYHSGATGNDIPSYERMISFSIELTYPNLDTVHTDSDTHILTSALPFTKDIVVCCNCDIFVAVLLPLVTVNNSKDIIEYNEGTPPDRCIVIEECMVKAVPNVEQLPSGRLLFTAPLVSESQGIQQHQYDGLVLRVCIGEGYTIDDFLTIKVLHDDDISIQNGRVLHDGLAFADVTKGILTKHKEHLDETSKHIIQNTKSLESSFFELKFFGPEAKPAVISKFLRRIRFFNRSQNPIEQLRIIDISFSLPEGSTCSLLLKVRVIGQDDPASMTLLNHRLFYRQGSSAVPEHLRKYLRQVYLPFLEGIIVEDIDTTHFCSGDLTVTLSQGLKGDEIGIRPSNVSGLEVRTIPIQDGVTEVEEPLKPPPAPAQKEKGKAGIAQLTAPLLKQQPRQQRCIYHFDQLLGTLTAGNVFPPDEPDLDNQKGLEASIATEATPQSPLVCDPTAGEVRISFGQFVPLSSVQYLMRSLSFLSNSYQPPEGWRKVAVMLRLGESVKESPEEEQQAESQTNSPAHSSTKEGGSEKEEPEYTVLEDSIEIRVVPPLFTIPGQHWKAEYREGSGAVRIAPFEVCLKLFHPFNILNKLNNK